MRSLAPLRVRPFGRLLTAYTINELGDSIAVVALAILVYDQTGDAFATTALFVATRFIPALLAPVLTARIDQVGARPALVALYALEAAVFGVLALLVDNFLLVLVLALAFVDGTLALTARALVRGSIANVLTPRGLLRDGNALINIGFALGSVAGAALGGILVAAFGVAPALAADAASFGIVAVILASARGLPEATPDRIRVFQRLREGLAYARRTRAVRLLLAGQGLALFFFTLVIPIEVIYAKETLGAGDFGFGMLLASWGAGIVIGSALFVALRNRDAMSLVAGSTLTIGVAYVGLSLADALPLACLLSVLGGTGNGIQWVSVMTMLQERTPAEFQARIAGFLESLLAAVPGAGYVAGGALTAATSPRAAYAVAGGGAVLIVVLGALALMRRPRPARLPESRRQPVAPTPAGAAEPLDRRTAYAFAGAVLIVVLAALALLRRGSSTRTAEDTAG